MIYRFRFPIRYITLEQLLEIFERTGERVILEDGKVTGCEIPEEGQADAVT